MIEHNRGDEEVPLLIPWLSLSEQLVIYISGATFNSPSQQEKLHATTSVECEVHIAQEWLEKMSNLARKRGMH
jgi:hypothetical protein